jgi:hypothetical protein
MTNPDEILSEVLRVLADAGATKAPEYLRHELPAEAPLIAVAERDVAVKHGERVDH